MIFFLDGYEVRRVVFADLFQARLGFLVERWQVYPQNPPSGSKLDSTKVVMCTLCTRVGLSLDVGY